LGRNLEKRIFCSKLATQFLRSSSPINDFKVNAEKGSKLCADRQAFPKYYCLQLTTKENEKATHKKGFF
jgi:hypothetical protein